MIFCDISLPNNLGWILIAHIGYIPNYVAWHFKALLNWPKIPALSPMLLSPHPTGEYIPHPHPPSFAIALTQQHLQSSCIVSSSLYFVCPFLVISTWWSPTSSLGPSLTIMLAKPSWTPASLLSERPHPLLLMSRSWVNSSFTSLPHVQDRGHRHPLGVPSWALFYEFFFPHIGFHCVASSFKL